MVAQENFVFGIYPIYENREPENIFKSMIRCEIQLRLEIYSGACYNAIEFIPHLTPKERREK